MLVSRENSGDSRSEPDSTMQLAGGSQDRLTVPAMATPALSSPIVSTVVALTNAAPTNASTPTTDESSSTDPAMRRRRLSNLYKVIPNAHFHHVICCFPVFITSRDFLIALSLFIIYSEPSSIFLFSPFSVPLNSRLGNRSRAPSTSVSALTVWRSPDQKNLWPPPKGPA